MIKQGICVKKETIKSKVILIVDENNIEVVNYFTDFLQAYDDENWNFKIEIGDYLTITENNQDHSKSIYSKDFHLKTVPTNFKVDTKLQSDKDGQYFLSVIKEANDFEFKIFEKTEFEVLKSMFKREIFETSDKLYFVTKKDKSIFDSLSNLFSNKTNLFYTEEEFNQKFHVIEEKNPIDQ